MVTYSNIMWELNYRQNHIGISDKLPPDLHIKTTSSSVSLSTKLIEGAKKIFEKHWESLSTIKNLQYNQSNKNSR